MLILIVATACALKSPKRLSLEPRGGAQMSETAAVASLVKTIVGGGILALPAGMASGRGTGVIPALCIVLAHATLSAYTYTLVGRSVALTGAKSFKELINPPWLIDAMIFGVAGGAILTYGCFLGDLVSQLLGIPRTAAILGLSVALTPLALARDLSALKHTSMAGIVAVLASAAVIVKRATDGTYAGATMPTGVSLGTCVLFNMLSTAFMAHTNAVRAYRELADKTSQYRVAFKAFGLSAVLYASVMLAGCSTFQHPQGLILSNYARDDPLAIATRVATVLSIVSTHPLIFTSLRDSSLSLFQGSHVSTSLSLLAIFTVLAILVPNAGFVVAINGSSVGAALICVVPCLAFLKNAPSISKAERLLLKSLVLFGSSIVVFGSTITCLEAFTDYLS